MNYKTFAYMLVAAFAGIAAPALQAEITMKGSLTVSPGNGKIVVSDLKTNIEQDDPGNFKFSNGTINPGEAMFANFRVGGADITVDNQTPWINFSLQLPGKNKLESIKCHVRATLINNETLKTTIDGNCNDFTLEKNPADFRNIARDTIKLAKQPGPPPECFGGTLTVSVTPTQSIYVEDVTICGQPANSPPNSPCQKAVVALTNLAAGKTIAGNGKVGPEGRGAAGSATFYLCDEYQHVIKDRLSTNITLKLKESADAKETCTVTAKMVNGKLALEPLSTKGCSFLRPLKMEDHEGVHHTLELR